MPAAGLLLPTDFSVCAEAAYATAARLAREQGSELHLLHCLNVPTSFGGRHAEERSMLARAAQARKQAEQQLYELSRLPVFAGAALRTVLGEGPLAAYIGAYAPEHGIELIVMGSHGSSGLNEMLIGSHTQKVVRQAPCAVLVVKSPPETTAYHNVVFASSFEDEALPLFYELLDFVERYEAHVHLLYIVRPGFFGENLMELRSAMDEFAALCPRGRCSRHLFHADSLEGGLHTFLAAVHADLLCMAHYGQEPLRRLFQYSLTEAMVNHVDTPVLCLHGKRFPKTD